MVIMTSIFVSDTWLNFINPLTAMPKINTTVKNPKGTYSDLYVTFLLGVEDLAVSNQN
jgi:hypothetical protein